MEDVLGLCALVVTVLMGLMLSVWFCCSIVESFIKMRRGLKRAGYNALLRQNERLKSSLADAAEESTDSQNSASIWPLAMSGR